MTSFSPASGPRLDFHGRAAKPSGTGTRTEIRTELKGVPGTDSSIRFGRTELQRVREAGSGESAIAGGQTASQSVQPLRLADAGGQRIRAGRESVQQGMDERNVGGMYAAGMAERRILRYGV